MFDKDELKLVTVKLKEPDSWLTDDDIDDDTLLVNPLNPGTTEISNVIDPDNTPSAFILSLIVVLIEDVKLDKLPILELNPLVVVAIDDERLPTLELKPLVVVAIDDERLPIELVILELNVE